MVQRSADEILGLVRDPAYMQTATARILLAPRDLVERHAQLDHDLGIVARSRVQSMDSGGGAMADELFDIEKQFEDFWVEFRFKALPHRTWADLVAKHPPTKTQLKANPQAEHDDTFPAAAIHACLIDPEMTLEQVRELEVGVDGGGALSPAQFAELFKVAATVNRSGLNAPKSLAAGVIRRLNAESDPPPTTIESPDQSSLDG